MSTVKATCLLLVVTLFAASACRKSKKDHHDPKREVSDDVLTGPGKRQWLLKTARKLQAGDLSLIAPEFTRLEALPADQIVDELLSSQRFDDMVVDFGMYMLGLKNDQTTYPDPSDSLADFHSILNVPQVFHGAQLLKDGGDFLSLFDENVPVIVKPFSVALDFKTFEPIQDSRKARKEAYAKVFLAIDAITTIAAGNDLPDETAYCQAVLDYNKVATQLPGVPFTYALTLVKNSISALITPCFKGNDDATFQLPPDIEAVAAKMREQALNLFTFLDELEADDYMPRDFRSIKWLDVKRLALSGNDGKALSSLEWFWSLLPNSSTNYNRKRANYVLKRFFCDDLTPINVLIPEDHAGKDRHASDPSCQSCHYKLDPMAGFFRMRGAGGSDVSDQEIITFDDGAKRSVEDYSSSWKRDEETDHPWNVGYVRSSTDHTLTDWGDHPENPALADLFGVIRRAPEAKKCLVRRMFEYFVGEGQALDAGWLDHLTKEYMIQATTDSSRAFKQTTKALVLSRTFRTSDPESEQCYDFAPGQTSEGKPPCKVAFLFEKHCATCHAGLGAMGGLNVMTWTPGEGGLGFAHHNDDGSPLPRAESFRRIYDRLISSDSDLRMPLNRYMDAGDREVLFTWITDQLKRTGELK